jgi:hypothetical protein
MKVNVENVMSQLSPSEQKFAILGQKIMKQYGEKGADAALDLGLSAKMIDSPDWNEQDFLRQVEEKLKS